MNAEAKRQKPGHWHNWQLDTEQVGNGFQKHDAKFLNKFLKCSDELQFKLLQFFWADKELKHKE